LWDRGPPEWCAFQNADVLRTAWFKDVLICLCNRSKTSGAVLRSSKELSPSLPGSLVVRIRRSHRRGPGSIPGQGSSFLGKHWRYHAEKDRQKATLPSSRSRTSDLRMSVYSTTVLRSTHCAIAGRDAGRATARGEKWTKWTSMRNREKIRPSSCRSVKKASRTRFCGAMDSALDFYSAMEKSHSKVVGSSPTRIVRF